MGTVEQHRVDFLKKPENVAVAYEVATLFPQVRKELARKFWRTLTAKTEEQIASNANWQLKRYGEPDASNAGLVIRSTKFKRVTIPDDNEQRIFVQLAFQQTQALSGLFLGVSFNKTIAQKDQLGVGGDPLKQLKNKLRELDYDRVWTGSPFSFPAWSEVKPVASDAQMLVAVATNDAGLHPNFPPVISRVRRLFRPSWGVSCVVVVSCS